MTFIHLINNPQKACQAVCLFAISVMVIFASTNVGTVGAQEPESNNGVQESGEAGPGFLKENVFPWGPAIQALATAVAVFGGGFFAWRRGIIFRHDKPHVTIVHEVTHRIVSPKYIHIETAVTLHNTSRVKIEFLDGLFSIEQMSPSRDKDIEQSFSRSFVGSQVYTPLKWPLLKEARLQWEHDDLVVEPGEKVVETFEYIVPKYVKSVLISTHFCNTRTVGKIPVACNVREAKRRKRKILRCKEEPGVKGWTKTTAHDILA